MRFYDEAEGVLLILTVGVMVAGAVGMYVAATGDVDTVTGLAGKLAELPSVTVLGKVDLGLTDIVLKLFGKEIRRRSLRPREQVESDRESRAQGHRANQGREGRGGADLNETKVQIAPKWFNTFVRRWNRSKAKRVFRFGIIGGTDTLAVQVKANVAAEDKKKSVGGSVGVDWKPSPKSPLSLTSGIGVDTDSGRSEESVRQHAYTKVANRCQCELGAEGGVLVNSRRPEL